MGIKAVDVVDRISRRLGNRGITFRTNFGVASTDPSDRLIRTVVDRLESSHPGASALRQFEADPNTNAPWIVEALSAEMESDADFAQRLRRLVREVDVYAQGLPDVVGRVPGGGVGYSGGNQPPSPGGGYAGGNAVPDEVADDAGYEAYGPPPGPITIPEKPE
jgi:hypothetical protein